MEEEDAKQDAKFRLSLRPFLPNMVLLLLFYPFSFSNPTQPISNKKVGKIFYLVTNYTTAGEDCKSIGKKKGGGVLIFF